MTVDPMLIAFLVLGIMHTLEPCADKAIVTIYAMGFSNGKAKRALLLVLIFGIGMVIAYMLIGGIFALVGNTLISQVLGPVQILVSLITIMLGVYLLIVHKEKAMCPGEHHHLLSEKLSLGPLISVLGLGFICGIEPCPVELTAYVWAASSGSIFTGITRMLAFSIGGIIGILPFAVLAGGIAGMLRRVIGERSTSEFAGAALIIMGIATLMASIVGIPV